MTAPRRFRFQREDFSPLPVTLRHADVHLDFAGDRVDGQIDLHLTARQPLTQLALDARDIAVHRVATVDAAGRAQALPFALDTAAHKLRVSLPAPLPVNGTLVLRVAASCVPSDHVLEGIYRDATPPGAPQQFMSQCQQWGFQRILPIFDDCTAKCTFTTTIEADARYTHLISNGNVDRTLCPGGRPVPKPGDPTRQLIRYRNPVPMAPYLFLVCVGTWDMLADEVIYPSGRRVRLEYLVPPGKTADARIPMDILKDSILWQGRTQNYEYPFDTYRTICMEKSNFGGMENVGNTTIITSAALIDAFTGDRRLVYAHGIIIHEYEHNQCGSDVTMETPFDMWLNEAFTVDVERQYSRGQFDPDVLRLDEVDEMRAPLVGPLAVEDAGHMGNIVRAGFNDPDELVDGVTYVKAAEVIRMLRLIVGDEPFRRGKDAYFARYRGANANTDQFFACFEEASGRDLSQFKREWLYTIGYPQLTATHAYDAAARRLTVTLAQTRVGSGGPFHVPVAIAAVDAAGRDIPGTIRVAEVTGARAECRFENVPAPAFLSLNRDGSFYGTCADASATPATLALQARLDPNAFNRVEALRQLTDSQRIRLLQDPNAAIDPAWLDLLGDVLADAAIPPGLKAHLLRIDEQSRDRRYIPWYRERYAARARLLAAVAASHLPALTAAFHATDTYAPGASPKDGMDRRALKAALLRILVAADTPAVHTLAADHFRRAWHFTDRLNALHALQFTTHPDRAALLEEAFAAWHHHLNGYAGYLGLIAAAPHADTFDRIAAEERRPLFDLAHPNHNRALFLPMAANNKLLWTDAGLAWLADTAIRLAVINENTTNRLIAALNQVHNLAVDLKPRALNALERMAAAIDPARAPSVAGRIRDYLTPP